MKLAPYIRILLWVWFCMSYFLTLATIFYNTSAIDKDNDFWLYLVIQTCLVTRMIVLIALYFNRQPTTKTFIEHVSPYFNLVLFIETNVMNTMAIIWGLSTYFLASKDTLNYYKDNYYTLYYNSICFSLYGYLFMYVFV